MPEMSELLGISRVEDALEIIRVGCCEESITWHHLDLLGSL